MRTVSYRVCDLQNATIPLGFAGENLHRRIVFKADEVYAEYPHAAASLTVRPPYGEPYPAVVARDGNDVLWDVTDSDLVRSGMGELQLAFTEDAHVCKTYVGKTRIGRSIIPTGDVPDPIEDFLTEAGAALTAIPETIDAALEAAKESGEFDGPQGPEGQDGQPGADGYSPTVAVTDITGGHRLTITDKNGTRTVDVMDGEDGQPGHDGDPGAPGFSPVITVTDITGGHRLTITTATGTQTVDVMDGSDGDPTELIDDTAGAGVVNKTWSADKLNTETSELKIAINDMYINDPVTVYATADGWRLNESDGLCSSASGYKIVKYSVKEGDSVKVICPDRFQFQTVASVPSGGTSNRVGDTTYGSGTFSLTVPATAKYIIVSATTEETPLVYVVKTNLTSLSGALEGQTPVAYGNGSWKWDDAAKKSRYANLNPIIKECRTIIHQGSSYPRKSTIEAYECACSEGFKILEADTQTTSDGIIVVWHDDTYAGLNVKNSTLEQLKALTVNGGVIPTAQELIDLAKRNGVCIEWDLTHNTLAEAATEYPKLYNLVVSNGFINDCFFTGQNTPLQNILSIDPYIPVCLSALAHMEEIGPMVTETVTNSCYPMISLNSKTVDDEYRDIIAWAHQHGAKMKAYGPESDNDIFQAISDGFDKWIVDGCKPKDVMFKEIPLSSFGIYDSRVEFIQAFETQSRCCFIYDNIAYVQFCLHYLKTNLTTSQTSILSLPSEIKGPISHTMVAVKAKSNAANAEMLPVIVSFTNGNYINCYHRGDLAEYPYLFISGSFPITNSETVI